METVAVEFHFEDIVFTGEHIILYSFPNLPAGFSTYNLSQTHRSNTLHYHIYSLTETLYLEIIAGGLKHDSTSLA